MKKYIVIIGFILLGSIGLVKGQITQADMDRYWRYRDRLVTKFMSMGMGNSPSDPNQNVLGQSLPADIRNLSNGTTLSWGDEGRTMGYYIGTLALEYRLLKDNNQPTNETVMELFYALHALYRLDSIGYQIYSVSNSFPLLASVNSNSPLFPGKGFMIQDDVPPEFISLPNGIFPHPGFFQNGLNADLQLAEPSFTTEPSYYPNGGSEYGNGLVGPVSSISSSFSNLITDQNVFEDNYSQDNYFTTLLGLSLAANILDDNITCFIDQNGYTQNIQQYTYNTSGGLYYDDLKTMARDIGRQICNYLYNGNQYALNYPGNYGSLPAPDGYPIYFSKPIAELSSNIFGQNLNYPGSIEWNNFNYNDWLGFTTGYTWGNIEFCCELAAMSNDGGEYGGGNGMKMIQDFGNHGAITTVLGGYFDANQYGWDLFYGAVNRSLYQLNVGEVDICGMQNIIQSAPFWGPFCHQNASNAGNGVDYSPNGWGDDRRFIDQPAEQDNGKDFRDLNDYDNGFQGNYNGLDYMMFFNLYCYMCELYHQQYTTYINDRGFFPFYGSCDFSGIPNIYPYTCFSTVTNVFEGTTTTTYGATGCYGYDVATNQNYSFPYSIYNADGAPIYINHLTETANQSVTIGSSPTPQIITGQSGYLTVHGSNTSFIDLIPTGVDPYEGPIIIHGGAYFDAICDLHVCSLFPSYISELPKYTASQYYKPIRTVSDSTYTINSSFDTLHAQNGIMNYPNPFNSQTTLEFILKNNSTASIFITDMTGNLVAKIINNETFTKGAHVINYNGSNLSNGKYICVLENKDFRKTCTIVKTE
jgi:hypothetical protein